MDKNIPHHLKNKNATLRWNQDGLRKLLGDLESDIMMIVWDFDAPVTVREVYETLREGGKKLSYLTIMTVMNRLEEKGILKIVDVISRANVFLPAYTRQYFLEMATGHIIENLLQDFPEQMAIHFKRHQSLKADQDKLSALSKKVRGEREKRKSGTKKND